MKLRYNYRLILALAILLPFAGIVSTVAHYGVNVPVTDQYEMIPLFQKVDAGTLHFSDIWAQHNEHRPFFPNIIMLVLAGITHWNIRAEIGMSLVLSLISFTILTTFIHKTLPSRRSRVLVSFLCGLWFFSPVQWQNWLWGWQIEWYLCVCASMLALFALSKINPKKTLSWATLFAIVFGFVASYSLASGLFLWLAGLAYLLIRRLPKYNAISWSVAGIICSSLYFLHYITPGRQGPIASASQHPVAFTKFFMAFVGRPLSDQAYAAILLGIGLVLYFVFLLVIMARKQLLQRYALWISLALYTLMAGVATSAGRIDLGIINALSSRYTAFSVLFIISLIVMSTDIALRSKIVKLLFKTDKDLIITSYVVFILIGIISSYYNGFIGMQTYSAQFRYIASCTRVPVPDANCLYQAYFPSYTTALKDLNYLKQKHYGGY